MAWGKRWTTAAHRRSSPLLAMLAAAAAGGQGIRDRELLGAAGQHGRRRQQRLHGQLRRRRLGRRPQGPDGPPAAGADRQPAGHADVHRGEAEGGQLPGRKRRRDDDTRRHSHFGPGCLIPLTVNGRRLQRRAPRRRAGALRDRARSRRRSRTSARPSRRSCCSQRRSLRQSDFGLDTALKDLPNSAKIAGVSTPLDITAVSLTLKGKAARRQGLPPTADVLRRQHGRHRRRSLRQRRPRRRRTSSRPRTATRCRSRRSSARKSSSGRTGSSPSSCRRRSRRRSRRRG